MIRIVFRNSNFIICDKPAEVLSVPSRDRSDPRACLGTELQKELKTQIFPVHRLDFEVSGLIIYALNSQAHKLSQNWFQKKMVQKKYLAETELQNFDHWPQNVKTDRRVIEAKAGDDFYWKTKILKGKKRSFESENGEWAETKAIISSVDNSRINWILYPITGKSHQLRFELSRHGFPILGDLLYGSKLNYPKGIALKAVQLDLKNIPERAGLPEIINL